MTAGKAVSIILLRGINVGGQGKLPMKALKALLEDLGYESVATYIQSGNVVLQSGKALGRKDTERITEAIEAAHGFRPAVLVVSLHDLLACAAANPFPEAGGKTLHAFFLQDQPGAPDWPRLEKLRREGEAWELHCGDKCSWLYLHTPGGFGTSRLPAGIERALGEPCTARNWNTVQKLLTMAQSLV
ncbi:DUF1697 domain-containing protein [Hydrogenophaga sp. 5NK40-0174]|uniref:DUF1697 domain-containing protein n=1 Tax=Hydrogenophaga sp. 5NK40-0174 TaxID=3127649 RepID=UPI00310A5650